jgi:hypothetical protein
MLRKYQREGDSKMGDLFSTNRNLFIKRYEYNKQVAQSNIMAREIRIMELEEEMERCRVDIEAQKKVIAEAEMNIKQQLQEIEKEKAAAKEKKN